MADNKMVTIDPLILETLNLNQRRMNHILDILHGRQPREYPKTQRKAINSVRKNRTISNISQNQNPSYNLPPIFTIRPKVKPQTKVQQKGRASTLTSRRLTQVKSNSSLNSINQQPDLIKKYNTIDTKSVKTQKQKPLKNNTIFKQKNLSKQSQKNAEQDINVQQQLQKLKLQRKHQIMKDYMLQKLQKSKSEYINQRDIYRFDIESMVAQLTPFEDLQQAEKRMKRLKRKHKHLVSFDKNYFMKLNQHDMLNLI